MRMTSGVSSGDPRTMYAPFSTPSMLVVDMLGMPCRERASTVGLGMPVLLMPLQFSTATCKHPIPWLNDQLDNRCNNMDVAKEQAMIAANPLISMANCENPLQNQRCTAENSQQHEQAKYHKFCTRAKEKPGRLFLGSIRSELFCNT